MSIQEMQIVADYGLQYGCSPPHKRDNNIHVIHFYE